MSDKKKSFPEKTYKMDRTFGAVQYQVTPNNMIKNQLRTESKTKSETKDKDLRPEDGNLNN